MGVVAHTYNPSYLGGGEQEDHGSRPSPIQIFCESPSQLIKSWAW
jgi:hypothetical protein